MLNVSDIRKEDKNMSECVNSIIMVTADQESWVKSRIRTAVEMAIKLNDTSKVMADAFPKHYGIEGIIEGTAREIITTLGLTPSYENIRKL